MKVGQFPRHIGWLLKCHPKIISHFKRSTATSRRQGGTEVSMVLVANEFREPQEPGTSPDAGFEALKLVRRKGEAELAEQEEAISNSPQLPEQSRGERRPLEGQSSDQPFSCMLHGGDNQKGNGKLAYFRPAIHLSYCRAWPARRPSRWVSFNLWDTISRLRQPQPPTGFSP